MLFWRLFVFIIQNEEDYEKNRNIDRMVGLGGWHLSTELEPNDCMKYAVEHATEVKREVVNARQRKQDYQHAVAGFPPTVERRAGDSDAWGRNIDPETNTYNT